MCLPHGSLRIGARKNGHLDRAGLQSNGNAALANIGSGIQLVNGASNNLIGTDASFHDLFGTNYLSGNALDGIDLLGGGTGNNLVAHNKIGTNVAGTVALPNQEVGIIVSSNNNTIGANPATTSIPFGNVISGNGKGGIVLDSASGTLIVSNYIGLSPVGVTMQPIVGLPNGGNGITFNTSNQNTVGGATSAAGNTIGFNTGTGVFLNGSTGVSILSNSIHDNGDLGISSSGVSLPAAPTVVSAVSADRTYVTAQFPAVTPGSYHLEFFASPTADPSGFGQGQVFLGSQDVTVAQATANLSVQAAVQAFNTASFLTATLTDPTHTTSLFSRAVPIQIPGSLEFQFSNATAPPGGGVVSIPVSRVGGSDGTVTVDFATTINFTSTDGTPSAVPGTDFLAKSGTLTFGPGVTSQLITITTLNNPAVTVPRRFEVTLANPTGHAELLGATVPPATNVTVPPGVAALSSLPASIVQYVQSTYQAVLQRAGDTSGVLFWGNLLQQGMTRAQVVLAIEHSMEYRIDQVQGVYLTYLHHPADTDGLNLWVPYLMGGGSLQQIQAQVLGSTEYFQRRGGGTNNGFLTSVYGDVVFRQIDGPSLASLGTALQAGADRSLLALGVLGSFEADADLVGILYHQFLQRNADPAGLQAWVNSLQAGSGIEDVIAGLAGSDEYFARQQSGA